MKAKPELLKAWQGNPDGVHQLIIRTALDIDQGERRLREHGVQVRRRCKLINGFVITCTGQQAQELMEEEWVTAVDLDAPVSACP